MHPLPALLMQIATLLLVSWLVVFGYFAKVNALAKWPMFTRDSAIVVEIVGTQSSGPVDVNIYALIPSHTPAITPRQFGVLLDYLCEHYDRIDGAGQFFGTDESFGIKIVDGHVVD